MSLELNTSELGIQNLLNCFSREVLAPNAQIKILAGDSATLALGPVELRDRVFGTQGKVLVLDLNATREEVWLAVHAESSCTGTYEYLGMSFVRQRPTGWIRLDGNLFGQLIQAEMRTRYAVPGHVGFLTQIESSLSVAQQLSDFYAGGLPALPRTFIQAEQSLVFGHPFHPSPKSRPDFNPREIKRFSPEFQARFPLHYLLVRPEFLTQGYTGDHCPEIILRQYGPGGEELPKNSSSGIPVPLHPWQAQQLLSLPEMARAIAQGKLWDLGQRGNDFFPTSSVRTLYSPGHPYFYKMALSTRITNCIRKNPVADMESSVEMTRILAQAQTSPPFHLSIRYPHFIPLPESAFISLNLPTGNPEADEKIREGTGIVFRTSFEKSLIPDSQLIVAAAFFGNQGLGRGWISEWMPHPQAREAVWSRYLDLLLAPLLDLYFKVGMMFEPHLQNTIVSWREGRPLQIFMRDFENARVIEGSWAAKQLGNHLSAQCRQDILYSEDQAWKRFIYCLWVNHLCEAIYQLSYRNPILEKGLWDILREKWTAYAAHSLDTQTKKTLNRLLSDVSLPSKANLKTRFLGGKDREATYVPIRNPLCPDLYKPRPSLLGFTTESLNDGFPTILQG